MTVCVCVCIALNSYSRGECESSMTTTWSFLPEIASSTSRNITGLRLLLVRSVVDSYVYIFVGVFILSLLFLMYVSIMYISVGCICQYGDLHKSCWNDPRFGCPATVIYIRDGWVGQQVGQWWLEDIERVSTIGRVYTYTYIYVLSLCIQLYLLYVGRSAYEQHPWQRQWHVRHRSVQCRPNRIS